MRIVALIISLLSTVFLGCGPSASTMSPTSQPTAQVISASTGSNLPTAAASPTNSPPRAVVALSPTSTPAPARTAGAKPATPASSIDPLVGLWIDEAQPDQVEIEFTANHVECRTRLKATIGTQVSYSAPQTVWSGQWRRLDSQHIQIKYDRDIAGTGVKAGDTVVWNASVQGDEARLGETTYQRKQ